MPDSRLTRVPLSDLAALNPRGAISGSSRESLVSFIPMPDVSESGEWVDRQARPLGSVASGFTSFVEGDVLFAKITPCMENGKGCHAVGLVNGIGFGSTEFHVLRASPRADGRFIFHWSQASALRKKAEAFMIGSAGQQRVQPEFFDHFFVPALPLPEQHRIAEILDTFGEAIRKTEQVILKLQQMKQGLLQDLLTRGIDENGELRDSERHPEQFQDSPLGRIPTGWEVTPLREVVPKAEYGISSSLSDKGAIPVLRMMNFTNGEAELSDLKFSDAAEARGMLLEPGDVLFNRTNSIEHVGRTGIWRGQLPAACFASYLVRLVPATGCLTGEFLNAWLNWDATQIRIRRWATPGVQQVNINPTNLRRTPIAVPRSVSEQERITLVLLQHDRRARDVRDELEKLRSIKHGLMDDLLTGRVRITVPKEAVS